MPRMVSIKLFLLLLCLSMAVSCGDNKKEKAAKYISSARVFAAQDKPETAVIEYKNALQADPENSFALLELAQTYLEMNKINAAIRYFTLAAQVSPDEIEPLLRLAQIYTRTDRLFEARSEIARALEISPKSVEAFHILSGIQISERDPGAAINTLKQAQIIQPDNLRTQLALARLYIQTGQKQFAAQAYLKAMSLDTGSRDAYIGLVRLHGADKKWDTVETLLKSVVKTPGIPGLKYNDLAVFYEQQSRNALAEIYFQKAIDAETDGIFPQLALARFYTKTGRMDQAVSILERALGKQKKRALVLTGLSRVYLHFNEIEKADQAVDKALVIKKNNPDALFQKGRVLMARKNFPEALDMFDQVIGLNRFHAQAFYHRALCIKKRGATDRPEQRIFRAAAGMLDNPEAFEKKQVQKNLLAALALDPGLIEARRALAAQYLLDNRADKARNQVNEILNHSAPNHQAMDHMTMNLLAGVHILEGKPDEAEALLKTIVTENPEDIPAYVRLGLFYKNQNDVPMAVSYLGKAYEKDPAALGLVDEIVQLHIRAGQFEEAMAAVKSYAEVAGREAKPFLENLRGEIQLGANNEDQAVDFFQSAVSLAPGYIRPHMSLGRYWGGGKQMKKALGHYQAVEKADPKYLPALVETALIWDQAHDLDRAESYYRRVLLLDPKHPVVTNNLAFLLSEKQGGIEEAFRLAKTAREVQPENPDVMDTLGWIYFQKGSYFNALSEFETSLKLAPDSPLIQYHYGMTLYMTKSYEKARIHLKKVLVLDPKFRESEKIRKMIQ